MRTALRQILMADPISRWAKDAVHAWDFVNNRARWNRTRVGAVGNTPNWTFTRASTGYAQTAGGALVSFGSGVPRITDKGLLVEGARTNLLTYSQDFSNAAWTNFTTTVDSGQATGPDGTLSGWKLTSQGSGSRVTQEVTATATTHLFYAILKYGNTTTQALLLRNNTTATNLQSTDFNLQAGSKTDVTGSSSSITALGGGWYICAVWATTGITAGNTLRAYIYTGGTGSSSGDFSYAWHAQLENGAFPSSPILTTSASATRAADVVTVTSPGVTYPLSLFADIERVVDTGGFEFAACIYDGDGSGINRFEIGVESNDQPRVSVVAAGATQANPLVASAVTVGTTRKIAARCATNDVQIASAGTLGTQDSVVTLPATPTTIAFGTRNSGNGPPFGYLRRAAIFNRALADGELQDLTR